MPFIERVDDLAVAVNQAEKAAGRFRDWDV